MDRRTWTIVAGAFVILCMCMGVRQSYGLFVAPMAAEVGHSRELIGFGFALQNLLWGFFSAIAGAYADRFGPARVVAVGGVVYGGGLLLTAWSHHPVSLVVGNALVGISMGAVAFAVVLGAVARAAPASRRATAMGIASTGGSFGQFAVVPLSQLLIDAQGWVMALAVLSVASLVMVPLAATLRRPPATAAAAGRPISQSLAEAVREASGHRGFWLLTVGFFVCGFHLAFVSLYLPAYLADKALPGWLAAAALALVGLFNAFGTLVWGRLGDRYAKNHLLALVYTLRSFVFLGFLAFPVTEESVLVFAAALGLLWLGTIPLTSGLVAAIFGPVYLSTLYGIVFIGHQVGGFVSSWMGGWVYDRFGSFDAVWWCSVVLGFVAALLHMPVHERPVPRLQHA
ncbi:MAG: MFS transporter [Alphaproteobacteria bacterium]|nr:MFS transporter [Alphaproteobacteria bacterium]